MTAGAGGGLARPTGRGADGGLLRAVAPGRVNLIGEHIDYNGLPVLPIAIDRALRIDFRAAASPIVALTNAEPRFEPFEFRLDRPIEAAAPGHWSNYARAAARGLMEHGFRLRRGIAGAVSSDLPAASGLSSSSALVVASALALLRANGVDAAAADRLELAALLARAERFVGLEGGGMDQAACLLGRRGHALRIEFAPLRATPVPVPKGWTWLVASSLQPAEKSRGARRAYNERAGQCREALAHTGAPSYRDLLVAAATTTTTADPAHLIRTARRALPETLLRRFRHVVTEGRRVALAEQAMRAADIRAFGDLMTQSHASLRDDYEVSTEALDALVETAMNAGAAGARLTGAGFGGCAVILCAQHAAAPVMEAIAANFHAPRLGGLGGLGGADAPFAATPAQGARVTGADAPAPPSVPAAATARPAPPPGTRSASGEDPTGRRRA